MSPSPSADARSLRSIRIATVDGGLILAGASWWATPGDCWLVAHDIFHHHPDDDGSFACEAMSFGAQCWIEHHTDDLRLGIDPTSLCAILEQVASQAAERGLPTVRDTLILTADPPAHPKPDPRFLERFQKLVEEAVVESSFAREFKNVDDATCAAICDGPNVAKIVEWMSYGFHRAQARFPDPQATRLLFDGLSRALGHWDRSANSKTSVDDAFVVEIDEAAGTARSHDPEVSQVLVRCGVAGADFGCDVQVRRRSGLRAR